mgnify:CR=1 FL=1
MEKKSRGAKVKKKKITKGEEEGEGEGRREKRGGGKVGKILRLKNIIKS